MVKKRDRKIDKIKNFTFDDFSKFFHMTQSQASYELDVYPSIFAEIYKKRGISKWPYIKYRMLRKRYSNLSHEDILEMIKDDLKNEEIDKKFVESIKLNLPNKSLENNTIDIHQLLECGYPEFPDLSELLGDIF